MKLHEMQPAEGARHRKRRVGRGDSSGWGRTGGRGEKGQMSRSGANHRPFFEGGQIPLFRRLPKRGFNHPTHKNYTIVNVGALEALFEANDSVNQETLGAKGALGGKAGLEVKILAYGELSKPLNVKAHKFSEAARTKIEAVGGTCELIGG